MKKHLSPPLFFLKNNKAISNILAVVLLILITLVIGGLFFIFGRTMFSSLSTTASIEILDANLLLDSSGSATLQIIVKNTGNSRITISQVSIGTWNAPWGATLDAGQIVGKSFNPTGAFVSGQKVIVKVSATYDSNTIEKIAQVIVQG